MWKAADMAAGENRLAAAELTAGGSSPGLEPAGGGPPAKSELNWAAAAAAAAALWSAWWWSAGVPLARWSCCSCNDEGPGCIMADMGDRRPPAPLGADWPRPPSAVGRPLGLAEESAEEGPADMLPSWGWCCNRLDMGDSRPGEWWCWWW